MIATVAVADRSRVRYQPTRTCDVCGVTFLRRKVGAGRNGGSEVLAYWCETCFTRSVRCRVCELRVQPDLATTDSRERAICLVCQKWEAGRLDRMRRRPDLYEKDQEVVVLGLIAFRYDKTDSEMLDALLHARQRLGDPEEEAA